MSSPFTLKDHFHENRLINDRLIIAIIFVIFLFIVVILRLAILQVVEFEHFEALSNNNRVDIEALPPKRGLIYDRNGIILAENIPTFSLELVPEKVLDLKATIADLALLFEMSAQEEEALILLIKQHRRFQSVILRQRLTEEEVAKFSVNRHRFSGVDVRGRLVRHYPHDNLFAHVLGYVGRINERDQKIIDLKNYKGTLHIGKTGIEKQYEDMLHGTVGYRQVENNVQGRVVRELYSELPQQGNDLYLHLDVELQRVASEALDTYSGSAIVMDPRSGGVLAMVSKPDFDPNAFVTGISNKDYALLRDSPDKPLFDRSLRGRYPPGSTLKPFVALAGLEAGVMSKQKKEFCPGWYTLPDKEHRYRCWKKHGHGSVNMTSAIAQSCDVYFYDLAHVLGINRLHNFLDLFNFGQFTGIDIPNESKGLSPSKEWKRKRHNQTWYPGETLISGIGQGFNQTTPLQLAYATSILAMRGKTVAPRIVYSHRPPMMQNIILKKAEITNTLSTVSQLNWNTVINAMEEVVHGARGTAKSVSRGIPFKVAGKTGTAQVFGIKQDEKYDAKTLEKKLHDHALFIAFSPANAPEIAVAIVVENGGSGSKTAAPIAHKIIKQYFEVRVNE